VKDEHILRPLARIEGKLTLALRALGVILREEDHMAGELDAIVTEVAENKTVVGSAVALITQLKVLLEAAIASGDMTQVAALAQQLSDQTDALAAAVVAGTPAA
jgi:metal-responsive CopG/Arc/MetJ family transcriptional regulator